MFGSNIQNPILVLMEAFNNSDENFVATFKSLGDIFMCDIQMRANYLDVLIDTVVLEYINLMLHLVLKWWTGSELQAIY